MKELNQLEVWKLRSGMHWQEIAKKIGIEVSSLKDIREKRSPNVKVKTCMAIRKLTGLEPEEYLSGLDDYVILKNK